MSKSRRNTRNPVAVTETPVVEVAPVATPVVEVIETPSVEVAPATETDTSTVEVIETPTVETPTVEVIDETPVAPATDETPVDGAPATDATDATDATATPRVIPIFEVIDRVHATATDETNLRWFQHRETRNGISIPKGWGLCARAWYLFDDLYASGTTDTASIVEIGATVHNLNRGNLRTEISRYRKYHGIARVDAPRKVTVAPVTVEVIEPKPVCVLIKGMSQSRD